MGDNAASSAAAFGGAVNSAHKHASLFLLKLENDIKIPKSGIDVVINDVSVLLYQKIEKLRNGVAKNLRTRNIEFDTELDTLFQDPTIMNPFQGLHSEFLREKYYKEEMGLLVSVFSSVI